MNTAGRASARPAARRRNPRGQGDRLRDDLVEAASSLLAESGDLRALSLRAVARRVGITPTSVYLHFPDTDALLMAVIERRFPELGDGIAAAREGTADPCAALVAGCRAYCTYGLQHPGHYRVLFQVAMPRRPPSVGGPRVLTALVEHVRHCLDHRGVEGDPEAIATLLWAGLHGIVSLRIDQPAFKWRPLEEEVEALVARLVTGSSSF